MKATYLSVFFRESQYHQVLLIFIVFVLLP